MYDYNKKDYKVRDSMLNRTTSLDDGNRYDILYFDIISKPFFYYLVLSPKD